jgi:hypothetical protein
VPITFLRGAPRWKHVRRPFAPFWCAALIAAVLVASVATAAPAPPNAVVYIEKVPPVDVQGATNVSVTVNGTVNVTLFSFVNTEVFLNVTILNTFWMAQISPASATLTGSGSIPYVVTVEVPGTASSDSNPLILVEANVSAYGVGRTFSNQSAIPIKQYYGVELTATTSASPDTFNAHAGATSTFAFLLRNTGNGKDSFEVRVKNVADLQARGINANLPSPISRVGSGVQLVVSGNVTLPPSLDNGSFPLVVEAFSTGAATGSQAVSAETTKTITALPAQPTGPGTGNGAGNGSTNGTGNPIPGLPAAAAIAAMAVGASAAAWRRFKLPSQGGAYRASRVQGRR